MSLNVRPSERNRIREFTSEISTVKNQNEEWNKLVERSKIFKSYQKDRKEFTELVMSFENDVKEFHLNFTKHLTEELNKIQGNKEKEPARSQLQSLKQTVEYRLPSLERIADKIWYTSGNIENNQLKFLESTEKEISSIQKQFNQCLEHLENDELIPSDIELRDNLTDLITEYAKNPASLENLSASEFKTITHKAKNLGKQYAENLIKHNNIINKDKRTLKSLTSGLVFFLDQTKNRMQNGMQSDETHFENYTIKDVSNEVKENLIDIASNIDDGIREVMFVELENNERKNAIAAMKDSTKKRISRTIS